MQSSQLPFDVTHQCTNKWNSWAPHQTCMQWKWNHTRLLVIWTINCILFLAIAMCSSYTCIPVIAHLEGWKRRVLKFYVYTIYGKIFVIQILLYRSKVWKFISQNLLIVNNQLHSSRQFNATKIFNVNIFLTKMDTPIFPFMLAPSTYNNWKLDLLKIKFMD